MLIPNEKTFQEGDFLWAKEKGAVVPYRAEVQTSRYAPYPTREEWEAERAKFLRTIKENGVGSDYEHQLTQMLQKTSYEEVMSRYLEDREYGAKEPFSTSFVFCGHVAIVFIENGENFIVEATPPRVRRIGYGEWLKDWNNPEVWHGRLRDTSAEKRASIARLALTQLDKPYSLINLDLGDDRKFYCAKLAWWATQLALGIPLDGNMASQRLLPFSPKQMMKLDLIQIIFRPGTY